MVRLVDDQLFGTDRKVVDPDLIDGGLRSKQFATIIDLLGYGQIDSIEGVGADGLVPLGNEFRKNVFLDGTPLQNANGEENFSDVEIFFKDGASDQDALQEINAIEKTIPVNVEVTNASPIVRTITDTNVDKIRVSIQVPSLLRFRKNGDIEGSAAQISIQIVGNDGRKFPLIQSIIDGKATSPYVKDFEIKLTPREGFISHPVVFPIDIIVKRVSLDGTEAPDGSGDTVQNKTFLQSYTEIITDSSAYQGFAYVAIRFNAQEFQSYPKRMYRVKGTKILIPNGTIVDSNNGRVIYPDDYVFDGTFKTDKEWSSDPAWILYDLLTTDKGFGGTNGIIDSDTLDVFSFFSASKYASKLITDPITGTTEPRFSCNVILNQKNEAYSLINDLCSVMNAMPFYSNGSLQISQDRPTNTSSNTSDPQYIFNNSNVTEEGFIYQGVGQRTKYTEVEVAYFDNDTQTIDFELVTTADITALSGSISKFGATRKTLKAFACTSRGQANRLGRWFLYSNLKESEVVSFTTTLEAGVIVRPSTIIGIADSLRAGVRRGGRIKSVTDARTIVVDDKDYTDLTIENSATLTVILPNGKASLPRTISSINGTTITVSSDFAFKDDDGNEVTAIPQANSVWAIENTSVEFQIYRVVSIEESNETEYIITAVIHDANKYAQIEANIAAQPRNITTLLDEKPSPSNLNATEQIVVLNNRAVSKIFVSWQPILGVKEYLLEFQYKNDDPERLRVARPSFELFESRKGLYKFAVKSYNALGKLSSSTSFLEFEAVGKTEVPEDPTNLTVEPVSEDFVRLRFNPSTSVDVTHYGHVIIRHTELTGTNAIFANATEIVPDLSGNMSEALVPAKTGTYLIKFRDDGGRTSTNAAKVVITEPEPQPHQVVFTEREDQDSPPFQGTKVSTFFDSNLGGLVLKGAVLLDAVANFDNISDFDDEGISSAGPVSPSGTYEFLNAIDMGAKFNLTLKRRLVSFGVLTNTLFDDRSGNLDIWTNFDGDVSEDVNAKLLVATSDLSSTTSVNAIYEQSGTTITISKSSHGYSVGDFVVIDFASGGATDGNYEIKTVSTDAFTVTANTSATISSGTACSYGANFTRFNVFVNGEYTARSFKFKAELISNDPAQNIKVTELGYEASVKRRIETVNTAISSACATNNAAKTVAFSNAFFTGTSILGGSTTAFLPSIGITLEGAVSGDYFKITSVTGSQFVIETRDSSNNFKDLNFKYTAIGFGRSS